MTTGQVHWFVQEIIAEDFHAMRVPGIACDENVPIHGSTGDDKSTLVNNLGKLTLARGYVRRISLVGTLGDIVRQESVSAVRRRIKRYLQPDLLILGDLGYLTQDIRV